jgi:asparagine synthase (glutamine-hydrolysing)
MCGIFALFVNDSKCPSREIVEKNFNKIQPRGPDNSNLQHTVIRRNVKGLSKKQQPYPQHQWIGFHRLAINGLDSNSNQPFDQDDVVLVCNGEIYNHAELNETFGFVPKTNSDCEVIIHLYKKFGVYFAHLLDGVFAFILYDKQKGLLVAARDPIGVRPLFYQRQGDQIAFASEAKALIGFNDRVLGPSAPFQTMGTGQLIEQFPQGRTATIQFNKQHIPQATNFYSYQSDDFYNPLEKTTNVDKVLNGIRESLTSAVEKRLMSDRPIGCLLSGGVDSSIIAALLAKHYHATGHRIKTFSIGFDDSTDLKYARMVADHIDSDHHEVRMTYSDAISRIPDVIRDLETNDITTIRAATPMYLLAEHISKNFEETVIFSGEGADELLAGYLYFHYAGSSDAVEQESIRLVKNLPFYDVLRADRSTAAHGLELRVPFLDKRFVETCMAIDGDLKRPHHNIEKFYLRKAFENELPKEIVWRRKEAFSDGVGGLTKPWYRWIQEDIESRYPNSYVVAAPVSFQHGEASVVTVADQLGSFPSREAWYYNHIFRKYYDKCLEPVPEYWMPQWKAPGAIETNDPSGRLMKIFDE